MTASGSFCRTAISPFHSRVIFTLVLLPPCTVRGSLKVSETLLVPINDLPGYYIRNNPFCKAPIFAFFSEKRRIPRTGGIRISVCVQPSLIRFSRNLITSMFFLVTGYIFASSSTEIFCVGLYQENCLKYL